MSICNFLRVREKGLAMQKLVALNENGRRIGESHPRAKLLDHEVDQVLALLESGLSYAQVAAKMDVSKSCVAHIATGRRRGQALGKLVRVSV
jgi:DNA-binding NarL/FixJ family response regulator